MNRDTPTVPRWPLASRLDAAIRARYPTYTACARAAGLSPSQIVAYVRGQSAPTAPSLAKLLSALGLESAEALVRREPPGALPPPPRGRRLSAVSRALLTTLRAGAATTPELTDRLLERRIIVSVSGPLSNLRSAGLVTRIQDAPGRPWCLTPTGRRRADRLADGLKKNPANRRLPT